MKLLQILIFILLSNILCASTLYLAPSRHGQSITYEKVFADIHRGGNTHITKIQNVDLDTNLKKWIKPGDIVFVPMFKSLSNSLIDNPKLILDNPQSLFIFDLEIMHSKKSNPAVQEYLRKLVEIVSTYSPENLKIIHHHEEVSKSLELIKAQGKTISTPHFETVHFFSEIGNLGKDLSSFSLSKELSREVVPIVYIGGNNTSELYHFIKGLKEELSRLPVQAKMLSFPIVYAHHPNYPNKLSYKLISSRKDHVEMDFVRSNLVIHGNNVFAKIIPFESSEAISTAALLPYAKLVIGNGSTLAEVANLSGIPVVGKASEFYEWLKQELAPDTPRQLDLKNTHGRQIYKKQYLELKQSLESLINSAPKLQDTSLKQKIDIRIKRCAKTFSL